MTPVRARGRARRALLLPALAALAAAGCGRRAAQKELLVSAAISLQAPISAVARAWERRHPGWRVALNFGGSGALLRQIEEGAPVDVLVSASADEIERLAGEGRVARGAEVVLAHNHLALVTAPGAPALAGWEGLASPALARLAIGDPATVPAGRYAKQLLERAGLWNGLTGRLVYAENVRQVLDYVARRAVPAGIVYLTDVRTAERGSVEVRAVADRPGDPAVVYEAAPLRGSASSTEAADFCAALAGPEGRAALAAAGFLP